MRWVHGIVADKSLLGEFAQLPFQSGRIFCCCGGGPNGRSESMSVLRRRLHRQGSRCQSSGVIKPIIPGNILTKVCSKPSVRRPLRSRSSARKSSVLMMTRFFVRRAQTRPAPLSAGKKNVFWQSNALRLGRNRLAVGHRIAKAEG